MSVMEIPPWTAEGLIPPINDHSPVSVERSPYRVSLTDMVLRFGASSRRRQILDGLLRYRAALHAAGLTRGFQWFDGSYCEDIERIEARDPNDIDVVNFVYFSDGVSQGELLTQFGGLFGLLPGTKQALKDEYAVDTYLVAINRLEHHRLVERATYWYSMWSHRRNLAWKGFLQVDLAPDEDATARAVLRELAAQEDINGQA